MKVKDSAVFAAAAASDLTENDGYFVIGDTTLPGDVTAPAGVKLATAEADKPVGVISTPADGETDLVSVAGMAFGGIVRVKLGGAVAAHERGTLMAGGTVESGGAGTEVCVFLESGAVDELVAAYLINA